MGEQASTEPWWDWLMSTGPLGVATWSGSFFSAVGLLIAIFGFIAAIREAKGANRQASAAVAAVDRLRASISTSSLAYAHSQLGLLVQFVESNHFHPAHVLLATLKREMLHHAADVRASDNAVIDLKKRLKMISTHIGYAEAGDAKFKAATLRSALTGVQETIVDWENTLRHKAGEVSK